MSGHRVELHIGFTVGDECGREEAEAVVRKIEALSNGRPADDDDSWPSDFKVTPSTVDGIGWNERWPPVAEQEEPFDRLVRLTETHLRGLKAQDFSAALVDRLRRDDCMHDWSAPKPLHGYDDEIECLECGLRVIDGYRPYYPKKAS